MKNIISIIAANWILVTGVLAADLENKIIFENKFPKAIAFRRDNVHIDSKDYADYMKYCVGDMRKMITEEVVIVENQKAVLKAYYDVSKTKVALMHLNGEARTARERLDVRKLYFPGHWLYNAGSDLEQDIDDTTLTFKVSNAALYKMDAYKVRDKKYRPHEFGNNPPEAVGHDIVIVQRSQNGTLDWDISEFATLTSVDKKNGTITIARGKWLSSARKFSKGAYVAPLVGAIWGGDLQWHYNFSTTCPKDKNGATAADIFFKELKGLFDPNTGEFNHIHGIGWDVHYWLTHFPDIDVDNDGVVDDGYVNGENVYGKGVIDLDYKLRKLAGNDFLITGDSWYAACMRATGLFNGMENEGFCRPNDAYRGFSNPINMLRYWQKFGTSRNSFSYAVLKFNNPARLDEANCVNLGRMAMAACAILECGTTRQSYTTKGVKIDSYLAPEIACGSEGKIQWLGAPVGNAIFPYKNARDLLDGDGVNLSKRFVDMLELEGTRMNITHETITLDAAPAQKTGKQILKIKNILNPKSDVVLMFDVLAKGGLKEYTQDVAFPRHMTVNISPEPSYFMEKGAYAGRSLYNDLQAYFGTKGWIDVAFYFRNLSDIKAEHFDLTLTFEGDAPLEIKNIKLVGVPQISAREFENGIVLCNPGFADVTLDLQKLFPEYKGAYKRITAQNPDYINPNNKSNSIAGTDIELAMNYNNGKIITDSHSVVVPGLNGLFLIKIR